MDTTTRSGTALRQRMIDDMRMRKLEPRTREAYIRAVRAAKARAGVVREVSPIQIELVVSLTVITRSLLLRNGFLAADAGEIGLRKPGKDAVGAALNEPAALLLPNS